MNNLYWCVLVTVAISVFCSARRHHRCHHSAHRRIYGGTVAPIERFPWQVAIDSNLQKTFCSGSIIGRSYVLTAAHCFNERKDGELFQVKYGSSYYFEDSPRMNVAYIDLHPEHRPHFKPNDIAVLTLEFPLKFSKIARPIWLRFKEARAGEIAVATGWGWAENRDNYGTLLSTELTIIGREECKKVWSKRNREITDDNICAKGDEGKGVCAGDSGGPLVVGHIQVGIASWIVRGNTTEYSCADPVYPSLFVNVAYFKEFIDQTTRGSVQWSP